MKELFPSVQALSFSFFDIGAKGEMRTPESAETGPDDKRMRELFSCVDLEARVVSIVCCRQSAKSSVALGLFHCRRVPYLVRLDFDRLVGLLPLVDAIREPVNAGIALHHQPLSGVPAAPALGTAEGDDRL